MSVASWDVPGFKPARDVLAAMAPRVANLQGDRQHHAEIAEAIVVRLRPATPHYYLGAVGTLSDRQRRSYGSMVLEPVLTRAAEEGMDCYLETSSPGNVAFYERLGFVVLGEASAPTGRTHIWGMIRPGRPERAGDRRPRHARTALSVPADGARAALDPSGTRSIQFVANAGGSRRHPLREPPGPC